MTWEDSVHKQGVVVHVCNPSTRVTYTGEFPLVQSKPELLCDTLSQKYGPAGLESSLVAEYVPNMQEVLDSNPSTTAKNPKEI